MEITDFDVAIVGSGPGGVAAAMAILKYAGKLKIALVDKATFPREKICGDAIPSATFRDLEQVCPGIHAKFLKEINPPVFKRTTVYNSALKSMTIHWSNHGYMVPRFLLDDFIFRQLTTTQSLSLFQSHQVEDIQRKENVFHLFDTEGSLILKSRYIIGADGAPSTVVRNLKPNLRLEANPGSAVRCYYKDLEIRDFETSKIFFSKKYPSGYFWFFPIGAGKANLGFGMINKQRKKRNINLREAFEHFVNDNPEIRQLLKNSTREGELKGGFLPFSAGVGSIIGKGFALVGDAANLNDPLSGDGIRNAVLSGILIGKSLSETDNYEGLHEIVLSSYQESLTSRLHTELKYRSRIVRIGSVFPGLAEMGILLGAKKMVNQWIKRWI